MNLREISAPGPGGQVRSNAKEQGWGIPSASFRGGREICHPPLPQNIFAKEKRALCAYIWRKQVSPLGRLICGREFLEVPRLPLQSSGAASLGAAAWWLGLLGQDRDTEGDEQFPSVPSLRRFTGLALCDSSSTRVSGRGASRSCPELLCPSILRRGEVVSVLGIAGGGHQGEDTSRA